MFLPSSNDYSAVSDITIILGKGSKDITGGWSSLIGVVTAICGNILISFALNTQRYAHIRLSRSHEAAQQEKRKAARRRTTYRGNYGTQQAVTEGQAKSTAKYEMNGSWRDQENSETQSLIPEAHSATARVEEEDDEPAKEKSYLKSPIWWLGISLMVVGEIGNFLAYGFAPASIVSPLGVVALISNCIIAPLLLGEQFRWRDGLGVIIAIGGCVVVVLSASSSNPKLSPNKIWSLVTTWEFETYLGITLFLIVALGFLSNKFGQNSILIDLGLVALFGGYTALSTKGVASLLTYSIWRVVTFPITYLLLAVLISTAIMQIKYVNRALQRFSSTMVIPTQFVLFTLSVIIGSAVLYRDFEHENQDDAIKFVSGCALTFFGVWCITSGRKQESSEVGDASDEEDAMDLADEEAILAETQETRTPDVRQSSYAAGSSRGLSSLQRHHSLGDAIESTSFGTPTTDRSSGTTPSNPTELGTKPLADYLAHLQPADVSAVHTSTIAPMIQEGGDPQRKPPMHATTSEPLIPTTPIHSSSSRPKTPLTKTISGPQRDSPSKRSTTHPNQYLDPNEPRLLRNRPSVGGLFPGPLTSPLSGSLSAIVADELRRGTDKSPIGTLKRRKTQVAGSGRQLNDGPSTSGGATLKRHSIASGTEIEFDSEQAAELRAAGTSPTSGRIRSLSATLNDMFSLGSGSSKRQRNLGIQEQRRQQSLESAVYDGNEG